jgi:alpha-D-ribose 1-methylphosphonate 5-triphosphate diphosphatase PhnM
MTPNESEFWFTPNDYSPTYLCRVKGEEITLLKIMDHSYPGAQEIAMEEHFRNYIERDSKIRKRILFKYVHGFDGYMGD